MTHVTLVVVYRGKYCPVSKRYLTGLKDLMPGYADAKIEVLAVSTDPEEKAKAFANEIKANYPVAFGLSIGDARRLGLYISNNASFARPDLSAILNGLKFVQANNYPIRGTA